jgi:nucleotide-binding universal stress UspA family protein
MLSHILVAFDGSHAALGALDFAADLARRYEARLTVMHVASRAAATSSESADELLRRAEQRLRSSGLTAVETVLEVGAPASCLVAFATGHDVDLIVMGRRGLGGLAGVLLGSVSQQVANSAECPVLTVP